jgi:hypothetical protein
MSNLPDFKAFCHDACIKLWGEPDKRTTKELRWNGGDAYSVRTFDVRKRVWYDLGQQRGGSTLELVAYSKGEPAQPLRGPALFETWQEAHKMGIMPDPPPPKGNGGGKPIIATYPYHDEQGVLLFEVTRHDTSDPLERFRQRQPDGKDGWIPSIKGVRRVLYGLPNLIEAVKNGKRVLVCEGEKDANTALIKLGYVATTMPGGVGKWRSEFDAFFAGADVVVVSDNDPQLKDPNTDKLQFHPDGRPKLPGQDHAAAVVRHMIPVAAHVRSIIFPQKDLTAWVEAGGTREALDALIEQAPELKKQPLPEPIEEEEHAREAEAAQLLAELNRDNAVVLDGGKTLVLRFERVEYSADNEQYAYEVPTFLRFNDFKNFYLNRRIRISDDKTMSVGAWWVGHSRRKQYTGLVFEPKSPAIIHGKLNLWRGWGVEPQKGDWLLMHQHIKDVLCAGDEAVYTYSLRWLAWSVQHPDKPAEVALVFIGERGVGKGTLGKAMCRIFGQHARHISSADHLTGHFNAHLRACSFLFSDEAYAPKDRSVESVLKAMITEPTLPIEPKGRDRIEVPNCLHLMLASNNDWVVPAGMHERRFVVQEVSDSKRQDKAWFGPLYQQLASGGYGAMLYHLLRVDLGDWHPREIVRTQALADQQWQSLSALDEWWVEVLHTGVLVGSTEDAPNRAVSNDYDEDVEETSVHGGRHVRRVRRKGLFDAARASSPRLRNISDHAIGHYLTDKGIERAWVRRRRGWEVPPLADCRDAWAANFPDVLWHDQGVTDWRAEPED